MTLGYAKRATASGEQRGADGECIVFRAIDKKRFWRSRAARLYPSYLLTTLLNFLTICLNSVWSKIEPDYVGTPVQELTKLAVSLLGVNMWVWPANAWIQDRAHQIMLPTNGVAWTVQTMSVFYLLFPFILRWLGGVRRRRAAIRTLYWLQSITFMGFMLIGIFWVRDVMWGYWQARAWPLGRFPVFVMGCLAAVERVHGDEHGDGHGDGDGGVHGDVHGD